MVPSHTAFTSTLVCRQLTHIPWEHRYNFNTFHLPCCFIGYIPPTHLWHRCPSQEQTFVHQWAKVLWHHCPLSPYRQIHEDTWGSPLHPGWDYTIHLTQWTMHYRWYAENMASVVTQIRGFWPCHNHSWNTPKQLMTPFRVKLLQYQTSVYNLAHCLSEGYWPNPPLPKANRGFQMKTVQQTVTGPWCFKHSNHIPVPNAPVH